ncbi:MAG TPA: alpha/beta hydrolase [Gemmataceae bacterium]|nr:alpha/beta hydrolase [Gemmataceae bacterium]
MAGRWLVLLLAAGITGCASLEASLLYQPTRDLRGGLAPPGSRVKDFYLNTADGTAVHARWCPCDGADEALLFCHGNAGNLGDRAGPVADLVRLLGVSVLIFDYPGYGRTGGTPSEAGCYAAADAAYDWLLGAQGIPADRILVLGESLGGGVAVDVASRRQHRALILIKTFTSVPNVAQEQLPLLPAQWLVSNRFDNLGKIGRCAGPVFIAHGDRDRVISFAQGQQLFEAARGPKRFLRLPGCDHNDALGPEFYAALAAFLRETATAAPATARTDVPGR